MLCLGHRSGLCRGPVVLSGFCLPQHPWLCRQSEGTVLAFTPRPTITQVSKNEHLIRAITIHDALSLRFNACIFQIAPHCMAEQEAAKESAVWTYGCLWSERQESEAMG